MSANSFDRQRLIDLLDVYGADLARWDPAPRSAAEALIAAEDAVFLTALEDARRLDEILATDVVAPPSVDMEAQILNSAPTPSAARPAGWRGLRLPAFLPRWASAGGMALALFAGAGVGYAQTAGETELTIAEAALAYSDVGADWDAIDVLSSGDE